MSQSHPTPSRRVLAVGVSAVAALTLTVPAALPAAVAGASAAGMTPAIGLHPDYQRVGDVRHDAATFSCQTTTPAGCYGPAQIRAAYGVDVLGDHGVTGKGRSITIIDAYSSPTIQDDLASFDQLFDLPSAPLNVVAPDGLTPFDVNDETQVGWAGEITLDVEWAHAIAPAATINLVLARSSDDADIDSAIEYVVKHKLGDTISQSYGEAESCLLPKLRKNEEKLFAKAVAQGQTVFASAGDQGSAQPTCDGSSYALAASTPASDPSVTGVGGTILDADGITGAYHSETTWNEPQYGAAGGGGYSSVYSEPAYQRAAQHTGRRGVPDIAYNAAINGGVLAVWSSSGQGAGLVFRFGGTSAGSPQWAGLVALADQLRHGRIGFINDDLYALALAPKVYGALFHDITTGDNTYHGDVTVPGFPATPKWDAATGLGSPKATLLVPALALAH